jgi:hypothetical protein
MLGDLVRQFLRDLIFGGLFDDLGGPGGPDFNPGGPDPGQGSPFGPGGPGGLL